MKINPSLIMYKNPTEFKVQKETAIIDGEWDDYKIPVEDLMFYKSFAARLGGAKWEDTEYYRYIMKSARQGEYRWACKNHKQVMERCQGLDCIYEDIKTNGYKDINPVDRVGINITKNGQIRFNNGRHRLVFAKLLKLPSIPVNINVMHPEWARVVREIEHYAKLRGDKVYNRLPHITLGDIPYHNGDERLDMIKRHLPEKASILDMGAHFGFFPQMLEAAGHDVTAVESSPTYVAVLEKLKIANEKKFKVVESSIFDVKTLRYDVVLALNIFHHFLKREHLYTAFNKMLGRIECDIMFFQAHNPAEHQMRGTHKNFHPESFAEHIVGNSCLNYCDKIGKFKGRLLFKLTKRNGG